MIESLEIKNFKSHRKSIMAFSSGINAIIGSPNHGKTNIIRALLWLFNNRPLSGDILSTFCGDQGTVDVSASFTDFPDKVALRKRITTSKDGKSKDVSESVYSLGGREFKGMNKSVPDVIKSALNLTELNIQEQFDQPYLVNSTGGEVAKTINRITRQELADQLETNLTKKVNSINKEVKGLKEDIERQEAELKKLDGLDTIEAILLEAEKCSIEINNLLSFKDELKELINGIKFLTEEVEYLEQFLVIGEIVSDISGVENEYKEKIYLQSLLTEFIEVSGEKNDLENIDKELSAILKEIDLEADNYNANIDMNVLLENYIELEEECSDMDIEYSKIINKYIEELKKAKQCPLCFSFIDLKTINKIKEEL